MKPNIGKLENMVCLIENKTLEQLHLQVEVEVAPLIVTYNTKSVHFFLENTIL